MLRKLEVATLKFVYDIALCRQNTQETEFKKFLMTVHAGNVEELQYYNVAVIVDDSAELKVAEIMEEKLYCVRPVYGIK